MNDEIENATGYDIENAGVVAEQAVHNTEVLKRLGIIDEDGNVVKQESDG